MTEAFDVIEVQIAKPHTERVIANGLSEHNAEALINLAVMRRGVETHFYTKRLSGHRAPRSKR